eukprot:CAMPEP_0114486508 /NCGR_PEP_ID=MMETSP0109-20121206/252_1 /TAXON_ID=29199 /ORGANISM="Chlorarachnion reptans, Strain CCCM449" /LENGTH=512 /DNA_ID=CAMNT_0001662675 /DNA_START=244 /DNA_END=1782 /DNA_ORIENTATION=-
MALTATSAVLISSALAYLLFGSTSIITVDRNRVPPRRNHRKNSDGHPGRVSARSFLHSKPKDALLSRISARVTDNLKKICNEQIASGREAGLSICVYYQGKEIASVCAGGFRSCGGDATKWQPVTPETRFMGYSVAKGIAATVILTMVDDGLLSYDDPVTKHWPDFDKSGNKSDVTVAEALSHRAGILHTPLDFMLKYIWKAMVNGHEEAWRHGERLIERYSPHWKPGTKAVYHPVTFSWIAGGIIRQALAKPKCTVNDILHKRVCEPLGINPAELRIGQIPPIEDIHIARLEYPNFRGPMGRLPWWRRAIGRLESNLFVNVGNAELWRRMCLPSSNAVWTPRAVAKMYGAVANGGEIGEDSEDETQGDKESKATPSRRRRLTAAGTLRKLWDRFHEPKVPGGFGQGPARLGVGYCPWISEDLHGPEDIAVGRMVCHNGIGGCCAFGELRNEDKSEPHSITGGLAMSIGKTRYDPTSCIGVGSVSPTIAELVGAVREAFHEEGIATEGSVVR